MMVVSAKLQAPLGTSLKSLVKGYLLTHQTQGSSPNTVEYYWGILNRLLWYAEKENWPEDTRPLTEWHIREFLGYVGTETKRWDREGNGSESSSRKASPRTVHHYYSVLRSFFNWAVREDFLTESPVAKVRLPRPQQKVIRPYTAEQIRRMLQVCDHDCQHNAKFLGSRTKAIILILLDSGLRASGLASIRLADIDTDRGWIRVMGKGRRERVIRVGKGAQKSLWRYLIYRGEHDQQELWLSEESGLSYRTSFA